MQYTTKEKLALVGVGVLTFGAVLAGGAFALSRQDTTAANSGASAAGSRPAATSAAVTGDSIGADASGDVRSETPGPDNGWEDAKVPMPPAADANTTVQVTGKKPRYIDPNLLKNIDITGPKMQITGVSCAVGSVKVYFSASDPAGVAGVKGWFTSTNGGTANPPSPVVIAGVSPTTYLATVAMANNTSNQLTITATDGKGNASTVGQANLCR